MSGYIGPSPVPQSIQRRQTFTATASQTTFGTSGYTDGDFIDVYLNGVKLVGGTDYTATNGSDIVLTTGAAAGDILDFVTFNSFQLNAPSFDDSLTLQNTTEEDTDGGRESTIIFKGEQSGGEISTLAEIEAAHDGTADDEKGDLIFRTNDGSDGSAPTERLRIDSAGNVGIGTNDPSDLLELSGDTAQPAIRLTDADVSGLYHRIFTPTNTGLAISADTGNVAADSFLRFDVDGSERMRILSSGGITFNGDTAAANALDDYEEGTWDPTWGGDSTDPTINYLNQSGWYVKVGSLVWCGGTIQINSASGGSGNLLIRSFPFTCASDQVNELSTLCVGYTNGFSTYYPTAGYMGRNRTFVNISAVDISVGTALMQTSYLTNSSYINFSITYTTD